MGFLGFGKKDSNLVVVIHEGKNRLRLNGNRKKGKKMATAKRGAAAHEHTVCWIEFSQGGLPLDQGTGKSASKLEPGKAERLLRDLRTDPVCKKLLLELEGGRERSSKILNWEDRNPTAKPT